MHSDAAADDLFSICMREVKLDLRKGTIECNKRGLQQSAKWLAEINYSLKPGAPLDPAPPDVPLSHLLEEGIAPAELDRYYVSKAYFDSREYDRAAYFLAECTSPVPRFLHYYALYMAPEKRKLDNITEDLIIESSKTNQDRGLLDLMDTLKAEHNENKLDGYCLYLYGVVLKKLDLIEQAVDVLLEAVRQVPMLWAAWYELALIINDRQRLYRLNLPQHWMRHIFYAHTLVELSLNDEGIKLYEDLESAGFTCFYTTSQLAIAYLNNRGRPSIVIKQKYTLIPPFPFQTWNVPWRYSRTYSDRTHTAWTTWTCTRTCSSSRTCVWRWHN